MKTTSESIPQSLETKCRRLTGGGVAGILAGVIGLLCVLGVMAVPFHDEPGSLWRWFDLDRELNVVTFFSAGLLMANGWLVACLAKQERFVRASLALAAVFVFMGLDEALKIHETLEKWLTIDWQILYLPLMAVAGLGWSYVWWRSRGLNRWLWTAGAAAWVVSQLLEACQWGWWTGPDVKAAGYNVLMVSEELLEMSGSGLFLVTLFRLAWPMGLNVRKNTARG